MTCTSAVFGRSSRGLNWLYYIVKNSEDEQKALQSSHLVVLMFWAPWNQLSTEMRAPFRKVTRNYKYRAVFCSVNVDDCKDLAEKYAAEALPTFVLIKNGVVKGKVVGDKEDELKRAIESNA